MKKQKVFIVYGFNSELKTVLGFYPTIEAAQQRQQYAQENWMYDSVVYESFETGPDGVDLEIDLQ